MTGRSDDGAARRTRQARGNTGQRWHSTGRRAYAKGSARNPCRPFAHWRGNAGAIVLRHSAYAVHSYDFEVEEYV